MSYRQASARARRRRWHPRCFTTLFFNDTSPGGHLRRSFSLDVAVARQWVMLMLRYTKLPVIVMHNAENDVVRTSSRHLTAKGGLTT